MKIIVHTNEPGIYRPISEAGKDTPGQLVGEYVIRQDKEQPLSPQQWAKMQAAIEARYPGATTASPGLFCQVKIDASGVGYVTQRSHWVSRSVSSQQKESLAPLHDELCKLLRDTLGADLTISSEGAYYPRGGLPPQEGGVRATQAHAL